MMSRSDKGFTQEGEERHGSITLDLGTSEEQTQKDVKEGCLALAKFASIELISAKYGEPNIEETQNLCSTLLASINARPVWN